MTHVIATTGLQRAKSTPNIAPVITLEESRRDVFSSWNKIPHVSAEQKATEHEWDAFQENVKCQEYDVAIHRLDRLHIAPTLLRALPFHYNRALLNLLRFQHTQQKQFLQYARMDFDNAIASCRHFYFAYLGRAQVAFLLKDYMTAYNHLKSLIDVFEETHQKEGNTLVIKNSQFTGLMYLGDLYLNCAVVLSSMGSPPSVVQEHFKYSLQLLRYDHAITNGVSERSRIEEKINVYQRAFHPAFGSPQIIGVDMSKFITTYDASYDAGPLHWVSLAHAMHRMQQRISPILPETYVPHKPQKPPTPKSVTNENTSTPKNPKSEKKESFLNKGTKFKHWLQRHTKSNDKS